MKFALNLVLLISVVTYGQEEGTRFEQGVSWQQILSRAKSERKNIFVDCFATWCGPCKEMDKTTFLNVTIGAMLDSNFISVKMQLDTSKTDNPLIKSMYGDAHSFKEKYNVSVFPTYLFFSSSGEVLHKDQGYKEVNEFFITLRNALDTNFQYYTALNNYKLGRRDFRQMDYLARTARTLGDDSSASVVGRDYIDNYLMKLSEDELYTKENIEFISLFSDSKNPAFDLFLSHPEKLDKIMNRKGFSRDEVIYIIFKERINPFLYRNGKPIADNPDWYKIRVSVEKDFGPDYADRTVLTAKIDWYQTRKKWAEYCKLIVERVEKYGPYLKDVPSSVVTSEDFRLNDNAWELFEFSNDKAVLTKALLWSDSAIRIAAKPSASYFDTYANILYKLGRTNQALVWEAKAVTLDPSDADIRVNSDRMKKGEQTWTRQ